MAEMSLPSPSLVYRFGVFQANVAARELRKHGVRIRLPGQPFCILSILLEKPGEIVTRDEMRQRLWAYDTFVDFEHSLNTAIKKLRAALGDTPENSRYIETVPQIRRGPRPVSQGHVFLEQKNGAGISAGNRVFSPSHDNRPHLCPSLCRVGELLFAADRLFFCFCNPIYASSTRCCPTGLGA